MFYYVSLSFNSKKRDYHLMTRRNNNSNENTKKVKNVQKIMSIKFKNIKKNFDFKDFAKSLTITNATK